MAATTSFQFRPLALSDLDLLGKWRTQPHVVEWWDALSHDDFVSDYTAYLKKPGLQMYIVELEGRDIAFINTYHAPQVGGGWWPNEKEGTWGIDLFIGDAADLGQGLGTAFVRQLTDQLLGKPDVKKIILDTSPDNLRAISAYKKSGFSQVGLIDTPDGEALLMERVRAQTS